MTCQQIGKKLTHPPGEVPDNHVCIYKSCRNCGRGRKCKEEGCFDHSGETYCDSWRLDI